MPVTIKDIAARAGVSHTTVSRALNGNPAIPEKTTAAIRQIAQEMGYLPSAAARGLKTRHSHALGLIVSHIDNPYFGEIIQGIEDVTQHTGYSIFVASSHLEDEREKAIIQAFGEHRVDGVIIGSVSFNSEHVNLLKQYGIPIVVINSQSPRDYRYCIAHDDMDGARQITRHLISLGHESLAYIGDSRSPRINRDRRQGFLQEMAEAGLPVPKNLLIESKGSEIENGAEGMAKLLEQSIRPTAVFCFNDLMAVGALKVLQQNQIRVPDDVSIAGFDNIAYSAYTNPSLTTFDQPKRLIGAEAAKMLLSLITPGNDNNYETIPQKRLIQGELLIRESTAPNSNRSIL